MSARLQLLHLTLTGRQMNLCLQWCVERRIWTTEWNDNVLTDKSRFWLQHHDGRIRVWRHHVEGLLNCCVMHRNTGSAPGSMDNARQHGARDVQKFFFAHQIEFLPWSAFSPDLSPSENMWSMLAHRLVQYTPPATADQLWQYVEAAWTAVPQGYIPKLFDSMLRREAAVIAYNDGHTNYRFCHHPHVKRGCNFNRLIFVQHIICQINFTMISLVLLGVAFCVASSICICLCETY
ncbi:transposable element Tcb1 transposase [Trichonephila clavipes]|uniref:Transposable element Tcb1 transposase n=1 Tax=Trichonephila clavipes TaxID=2585209 RepID=A0A8X6RFV1_TRICX|nr:transposable element Tcb1 transposase [Trichonephila clavipes]